MDSRLRARVAVLGTVCILFSACVIDRSGPDADPTGPGSGGGATTSTSSIGGGPATTTSTSSTTTTTGMGGSGGDPPNPMCGNGMVEGTEVCDDGDMLTGDGCDDMCAVEAGWTCDGMSPTTCDEICGDGMLVGDETCEDGNDVAGDGCSDTCTFEATCPNGIVEPGETCDDSGVMPGDGCDANCQLEAGNACFGAIDLNDTMVVTQEGESFVYSGNTTGSPTTNFSDPSCSTGTTNAPTVIHKYTAATPTILGLATRNVGGLADTVIWGHIDCLGTSDEAFCDDDSGPSTFSRDQIILDAGQTVYILVAGFGDGSAGAYELVIRPQPVLVPAAGSDCATPYAVTEGTYAGTVSAGDPSGFDPTCLFGTTGAPEAVFELTFGVPTSVVLSAAGDYDIALHLQDGVCDPMNPMEIGCADAVGSNGVERIVQNSLAAGSYFIVMDGSSMGEVGDYVLDINTSTCGDSEVLALAEQCDDGNAMAGDGCDANCICETINEVEPNNTSAQATPVAKLPCPVSGAIAAAGGVDFYGMQMTAGETVIIQVVNGATDTCGPAGMIDSELRIFDVNGTTELAFNEDIDTGNNWCSALSFTAPANGTYFARIASSQAFAPNATFDYAVFFDFN